MAENGLNMINLVLTHLNQPWGPPWTLATLGDMTWKWVSHPTHPHLGEISQKKNYFGGLPLRFKFEDNLTKRNGVLWAIFSFIRSSCVFYSDLIHTQAHQLVRSYDCLHWPLAALLHISKGGLCYWVYNRPLYSYIYIYIASSEALVSDEANYRVAVNVCCCQNETGTFS